MKVSHILAGLVVSGAMVVGSNAFALPALNGVVKGPDGRAISGAEVRIQTPDSGSTVSTVRTDSSGRFDCSGISAETYRVTLLVNGSVKASINNVRIGLGDPTTLNFEFKGGHATPQAQGKHFVWVPSRTGTNIAGRWVEVDSNGYAATDGSENVRRSGGELIRRIQDNSGTTRP
jgi:hypothetical protein